MVSAIIHFFGLQTEHIAWTGDYAKVTPLATLGVDGYSTSNLCHLLLVFSFGLRSGIRQSTCSLTDTVNFSIRKITNFSPIHNNFF